jgi:hypothetical protein
MKHLLLITLWLATVPIAPAGPPPQHLDIGRKPSVLLVGAGTAKVLVRNEEKTNHQEVAVSFPNDGAVVCLGFEKEKYTQMFIRRRTGETRAGAAGDSHDPPPSTSRLVSGFNRARPHGAHL